MVLKKDPIAGSLEHLEESFLVFGYLFVWIEGVVLRLRKHHHLFFTSRSRFGKHLILTSVIFLFLDLLFGLDDDLFLEGIWIANSMNLICFES